MKSKEKIFVEHIQKHLREIYQDDDARVVCKICGKDIDQIYEEEK